MRHSITARLLAFSLGAAALTGYACSPPATGMPGAPANGTPGAGGSGAADASAEIDGGGGTSAGTTAGPTSPRIRRLTVTEYANTLADLLGTTTDYGAVLPADPVTNGFDDDADSLEVDQLFADEARINAETVAAAFDTGSIGCSATAGDSCAASFVRSFGQRALRRPPTAAEVTAYTQLFDTVSAASDPDSAIRAIVEAMLQSAGFLYRTELGGDPSGGNVALTPWEIASELSYLFWRTMPDAELFQHAQAGDLVKPAVVATEVARLLADPRGNRMLDAFADQWLESTAAGEVHNVKNASSSAPAKALAFYVTKKGTKLEDLSVPVK